MRFRLLLPLLVLAALATPALAQRVVLMTHDSFAVSRDVLDAFTDATGIEVVLLQAGDAGAALNRAALTRARPVADVLFGVDEGLLVRARDALVFEPYRSPELDAVAPAYRIADDDLATPVTVGFVTFNLDRAWFAATGAPVPSSLADLADPRWADLTVVTDPATSSPGLSLLLGTIGAWGPDAAFDWWGALRANGLAVRAGWSDAYYGDFTRYGGDRPIVLSYASSPAAEALFAEEPVDPDAPPTLNLRCSGCSVRQVETAGVLRNAANPEEARRLIDFLLQEPFQADVPLSMFVYPVRTGVALPETFDRYAEVPRAEELMPLPDALDGATVAGWIERWTDVVLQGR
ncbi:MAG: thiamine ABC transporter substrate-binding protein [Trueperaceae bacterium]|nr:thiamine ABC transporter substrate-binding protein [Trueperaceae bacterium]